MPTERPDPALTPQTAARLRSAARSPDQSEALGALRDALAEAMASAIPSEVPGIARQLRDTMAALTGLSRPKVAAVDEIARRRADRRADTALPPGATGTVDGGA